MKKIFAIADEYLKQSDWKTLALLKFCLCAVGVMVGLALPKKTHRIAAFSATAVFAATYIPLMLKLFKICAGDQQKQQ